MAAADAPRAGGQLAERAGQPLGQHQITEHEDQERDRPGQPNDPQAGPTRAGSDRRGEQPDQEYEAGGPQAQDQEVGQQQPDP